MDYETTNIKPYKITEGISLVGIAKDKWGNHKIITNKYGEEKDIRPSINDNPVHFALKGFDKNLSFAENMEQGNVHTIPADEWKKILCVIGYLREATIKDVKKTVEAITCSEELFGWEHKFIKLANEEEKQLFREAEDVAEYELQKDGLEEILGRERYLKYYKDEKMKEYCYAYVIMNSPRWLNAYYFLKDGHFREPFLSIIYNYILCYDYKDKIIEFNYFDEHKGNTDLPEQLKAKYNIPDTKMDYENRSFIHRNDMNVYGSEDSEYILVSGIQSYIDDWCGSCAVIKNGCDLTPFELHSFAESISLIERNMLVQMKRIRF